jgi:hypothetical protein
MRVVVLWVWVVAVVQWPLMGLQLSQHGRVISSFWVKPSSCQVPAVTAAMRSLAVLVVRVDGCLHHYADQGDGLQKVQGHFGA